MLKTLAQEGMNLQIKLIQSQTKETLNDIRQYVSEAVQRDDQPLEKGDYANHCLNVLLTYHRLYDYFFGEEVSLTVLTGVYLHDIGKLFQRDLFFSNRLFTAEDVANSRLHTIEGYRFLMDVSGERHLSELALYHHERSDGSGYPSGKTVHSEEVKLLATVDPLVAIYEKRDYRPNTVNPDAEWDSLSESLFSPYQEWISKQNLFKRKAI